MWLCCSLSHQLVRINEPLGFSLSPPNWAEIPVLPEPIYNKRQRCLSEPRGGGTGEKVLLAGLRALRGMEMLWVVNPSFGDLAWGL